MSKTAPSSRPVHPCVLSVFDGNTGAEYATWAHITTNKDELPNLVTAQGSTLRVYTIDDDSGKLVATHSFTNLAGTVCFLASLRVDQEGEPDSLLIGFCGHPQLAVVSVTSEAPPDTLTSDPTMLVATTLIDFTQTMMELCAGSVTPLEQDLMASLEQKNGRVATVCVILGGGVAVAAITLCHIQSRSGGPSGWTASEPYLLPLATLHRSLARESMDTPASAALVQSIAHGFGDILSICFLSGYLEPTMVMLHSNGEQGRTWSGRLGRPNGAGGTQFGLTATAITLTVAHHRSAILWSVQVPADALSLHTVGERGCLVMSVNSLLEISNSGRIGGVLSVNGWVQSSCPSSLLDKLQANPWPLPKLAIQLDGAQLSFVSEQIAILSLRQGHLYLLQHLGGTWSLMALGRTLGVIGEISNLLTLTLANVSKIMLQKLATAAEKKQQVELLSMGLLFAGSRLGDSALLGYTIESNVACLDNIKQEDAGGKKQRLEDDVGIVTKVEEKTPQLLDKYEMILQREEDALYEDFDNVEQTLVSSPDVIPPSSDEETDEVTSSYDTLVVTKKRGRARLVKLSLVRSLKALDTITSLGPVGPGCEGPLSKVSSVEQSPLAAMSQADATPLGATVRIYPCGYGSSGGLALVTLPGRDDRSILAEADCLNAQCLFSLPRRGLVLMGMARNNAGNSVSVLRVQHANVASIKAEAEGPFNKDVEISEMDLEELCLEGDNVQEDIFKSPVTIFREMTLLSAADIDDRSFAVLAMKQDSANEPVYGVVVFAEIDGKLRVIQNHLLPGDGLGLILSASSMIPHELNGESVVTLGCTWSSGTATVTTIGPSGIFDTHTIECEDNPELIETKGDIEEEQYYQSDRIHAIDIFVAAKDAFVFTASAQSSWMENDKTTEVTIPVELEFDEEDAELYGDTHTGISSTRLHNDSKANSKGAKPTGTRKTVAEDEQETNTSDMLYAAVCRQSGVLQVYARSDDSTLAFSTSPIWEASGCGQGVPILDSSFSADRHPRMHKVHTSELRFFFTGPTLPSDAGVSAGSFRTFNLVVETNLGDTHFYEKSKVTSRFTRTPLRSVARQSKEESRHTAKLLRKGILGRASAEDVGFRFNRLHPFTGITGQDGLFAATARPVWFISERGSLSVLCHESRHVAPAGGKPAPVAGFCIGMNGQRGDKDRGFLTLHERIGRVGSQRLSIFSGISNILTPHGIFAGGGLCVEKVPLGVTVRSIQFIDDSSVSSGAHPLYAVLISREVESDQSHLNDDGLAPEEKQQKIEAEEAEKVKRQVEADLGGFDLEQEWVEEIDRENCFEVDMSLGGAPPIQKRVYALWVVDASNKWNVVDSYEFQEFEHGMTMEVMSLTEVNEEPGAATSSTFEENDVSNTLFISVGTGIVDPDGEDVSSKGRVLLFRVNRQGSPALALASPVAELSLLYEKDILHGAVTTLSCLACEGRNRLVVGAGADVNVEQWGNGKLTQVGFFRANMQIHSILLFKTFFLLSDAYDSLYFLVWRESDKSLTLLAKDYEPMPVFAAGLMSRGGSMTFVCQDDRENLQFFQYAPGDPAARGGNKLVCRADFHLGSQTVGLQNHFCRSSLLVNSATPASTLAALKQQDPLFGRSDDDQRLGVHFGTSDGSLGAVVPVSEPVYWRLTALQSVITNALESNCSLSHRAWRLYRRTPRRGGCRSNDRKKSVIDGDLVLQYADLPLINQEDLASAIGSTVELILDNLLELRCSAMVI